ncbi:opioid growth factor receptor [Manis javanica]|uniref:opioid growth factor receptor n=1 Tax=Manis javanica TaxID=9974 RepID=UPI003C6CF9EC
MDDPDCDSTWEEDAEGDGQGPSSAGSDDGEAGAPGGAEDEDQDADERAERPGAPQSRMTGARNWRAVRDTRRYRHHYPDLVEQDSSGDMPNLRFYRNKIQFLPNGCFIEDILRNWRGDYDLLEDNHSYIQWLFPLREPGVNWHAKPLTLREVEAFKSSTEVRERLVQAYELMLGFYGIQLEDRDTGRVCRAQNYQKRFQNLNRHGHNNLRITRILKSLGELGLEHFQVPLVRFFLEETLVRQELPGVRQSALDYFVFTVRCRHGRRELLRFAWEHFRPRCKFVWGPHDKLRRLRPRSPLRPPLLVGPREAEGEERGGDPLVEAGAQGHACGPAEARDSAAVEPPEAGGLKDQGEEAWGLGEEGPAPLSPKESKKRKLEANRQRQQAPGEPRPQSASEVETIALNLEGCALSQGGAGSGTQEMGSQDPGEPEQPCPRPSGPKGAEEVRKRRKVDQGAEDGPAVSAGSSARMPSPASSERPTAGEGENGAPEEADGQVEPEQGAPRSPAAAGPPADQRAEAEPSARPEKP